MFYRQGDILLKKIERLPKGLKKSKNKVLAYGEQTGHKHQFLSPAVTVLERNDKKFVEVIKPADLVHEEHKTLTIDVGVYEIGQEREFDYFMNEIRKVVD